MKKYFNELEVVISKSNIPTVPKGTIGTVVHVYRRDMKGVPDLYEVEFIVNELSVVETVLSNQIKMK